MEKIMPRPEYDYAYHQLEEAIAERINLNKDPLYVTKADQNALWQAYIRAFPEDDRGYYDCRSCMRFIHTYGALVKISDTGVLESLLWSNLNVPDSIRGTMDVLNMIVCSEPIQDVFLWSDEHCWGLANNISKKTGILWTHLHGWPSFHNTVKSVYTTDQRMSQQKQDVGVLIRSLRDFSLDTVQEAVRVLGSDTLTRSEKAQGAADWFLALHKSIRDNRANKRNLIWRAVATAPPGYTHVRNTILGTLLDDIKSGLSFEEVSRRWAKKLHPLQYQRPQAEVSEGQIKAAENMVEKLGVARSLIRRFATLEDVLLKTWEPRTLPTRDEIGQEGVFDALRAKKDKVNPLVLPPLTMTWEKFARTILPDAVHIEINVPTHGNFYGLLTAEHEDSPAIFQWDGLEGHPRNPSSLYVYERGSSAHRWHLKIGWNNVAAIFPAPAGWQVPGQFPHFSKMILFAISGAQDTDLKASALFPESLKSELHEIRRVVENYSNITPPLKADQANANGLALGASEKTNVHLRVITVQGVSYYRIDRWD